MNTAKAKEHTKAAESEQSTPAQNLTRAQVMAYLDVSLSTVRRLEDAGRLHSRTAAGVKPRLYARLDVERLRAELRGEESNGAEERKARTDALVLMTEHARKMHDLAAKSAADREAHAERLSALLSGLLATATTSQEQLAKALDAANAESVKAIVTMRGWFMADAMREVNSERAQVKRELAKDVLSLAKPLIPTIGAAIARKAHLPVAEQRHQSEVIASAMSTLTDEQREAALAALTEEQRELISHVLLAADANRQTPALLGELAASMTEGQVSALAKVLPSETLTFIMSTLADVKHAAATPPTASERSSS
jgi:hypothetical protein